MTATRERQVNDAFVHLAGALARREDVIELLEFLTGRCPDLLDVASAGLLLADRSHVLHVMATSSDAIRDLEVLQVRRAEGPCQDCYRTGEQVVVEDLSQHTDRWPQFVPAALQAGVRSVHVVPLRLRSRTLGALGLFGSETGTLNERDLSLAQALADVAVVALTRDQERGDQATVTARLQGALDSRVMLEQAKGIMAQRGDLTMTQASAVLRSIAHARHLGLSEVAEAVVTRVLPAGALLEDAAARS